MAGASQEQAPAALTPLAAGERPAALRVAVAVAALLAVAVAISAITVKDLARHGGSLPGAIFLAGVFLALARAMHQRRHWAVLGFEALLAFQIIVTSLALVVAETWLAAGLCALSIGLSGWLFWKLVRVMGRIQAAERTAPGAEQGPIAKASAHASPPVSAGTQRSVGLGRGTDEALR